MRNLFVALLSITSFLIILIKPTIPGYNYTFLFPLVFLFCYFLFINPVIKKNNSVVACITAIYSFLRYIITPALISISGEGSSAYFLTNNIHSLQKASLIMVYELFILSFFLYLYFSLKLSKEFNDTFNFNVRLKGRKFIYLLLGIFSIILIILNPIIRENLSFLIIRTDIGTRVNEDIGSRLMLIRQIILTAIVMGFVTAVYILHSKYRKYGNKKFFYLALLFALINISIIVGERRIMQIYTAFASACVLNTLFPEYKRRTIRLIMSAIIVVVGLMSIYKFFYVFLYSSYLDAFRNNNLRLDNFTILMQAYFYGPQNVAISFDITNSGFQPITRFFYDIIRSTMGLNILVKDSMLTTSDVFNTHIYGRFVSSGHPVSGIGYGYMYFGFIISPFISIILLKIAIKVEQLFRNTNSLEMKYIWSYILIRLSDPFSAIPAKINIATLILFSWGIVYLISYLIRILTSKRIKAR